MLVVYIFSQSNLQYCSWWVPLLGRIIRLVAESEYLPSLGFPPSSAGNILPRSDSLLLLLVNTSPQSDHPCLRPRRKSSPDSISIVASSEYLFSIRSSVLLEVGTFPFSDFPCVAASEYLSSIGFPLSSVGNILPRSDSLLLLVVNAYSRSGHRRSQR